MHLTTKEAIHRAGEARPVGRRHDVGQCHRRSTVDAWVTATRHLMHFGQARTKREDGTVEVVNVEKADLQAIAGDLGA